MSCATGDTWIDQVYVILEEGTLRTETARLRQPFHREWPAVSTLIREAEFIELRCEEVRLQDRARTVNLAQGLLTMLVMRDFHTSALII